MKFFGTDGIRGRAGEEKINPEIAVKVGRALVFFCRKRNLPEKIVIARDTRESGPMLMEAVLEGITSAGGNAILVGVVPTPALAYLTRTQKMGMGLVISASHNPFGDNGFKPFAHDGMKLREAEEAEMEEYILTADSSEGKKENIAGKKVSLPEAKNIYADFILDKLPAECKNLDFKLILDCANGATYEVAPSVFKKVVKDVISLFTDPDGRNINKNCGSQHTNSLKKKVIEAKADLGLAFDGDGDRVIAIDEKGRELTGDQMIYIIAKMLKEKGELKNDLVVTTVMSNLGFVSDLKKLGIDHIAMAVGDRQVLFEMKKRDAVLGGEESGHIISSDFHLAGDGIVGGLMLVEAMDHFKKPLSELAGEITLFPKLLVNVEVKSKPQLEKIPEIMRSIREVENILGSEGRVLVRYSGTENLCRVMVEGKDKAEIKKYADGIVEVIRDHLG